MALSNITRKQARGDLRSRLAQVTPDPLNDGELNYWLNMGQQDVALKLSAMSDHWYGTSLVQNGGTAIDVSTHTVGEINSVSMVSGILSTEIMKLKFAIGDGGDIDGKQIPMTRLEDLYNMPGLSNCDNFFSMAHHGERLYFFWGADVSVSAGTVDIFFTRKPTDMTLDTSYVDVPTEYVDLVIMYAQTRALSKLQMLDRKAQVDNEIAAKINDIRAVYASDIQLMQLEKTPGVQTPRGK